LTNGPLLATTGGAVIKHARLFVLALAIALAGCAKASDLAAKQQETVAYAKSYDGKLYELHHRGNDYLERLKRQGDAPGFQDATNTLTRASTIYKAIKGLSDTVPGQVDAALKASKPDDLRKIATSLAVNVGAPGQQVAPPTDMMVELQRVMDSLHARLQDGYIEANAHLDTVEAWLLHAEGASAHHEPEPVPHPPPPPPTDKDDGSDEAPPPGAGSGSGSGAAPAPTGGSAAAPATGSATPPVRVQPAPAPTPGSAAPR
jgi:hypothetical protein